MLDSLIIDYCLSWWVPVPERPCGFLRFLPLVWLVGGGKVNVLELANMVDAPQHVGWVGWGDANVP